MVEYECKICEYKTSILTHYNKHLKTKKHKKNEESYGVKPIDQVKIEQKTDKKGTFGEKKGQKTDSKRTFCSKKVINVCKYCEKEFSSRQTLLRHEKKYCKHKEDLTTKLDIQAEIIERLEEERREYKMEKEKLYKQIEELIKKAGNTTIHHGSTITNNTINLNSYGKEDLSHITENFKTQLIKGPFGMIPKMIEAVHFNDKKPENKNISLSNMNGKYINVYKEGKWMYCNKNDVMDELMETNYYILDSHYEDNEDELNEIQKKRYEKFQDKYGDGDLEKDTKENINLVFLNGKKGENSG
jgi:hypothetical protein